MVSPDSDSGGGDQSKVASWVMTTVTRNSSEREKRKAQQRERSYELVVVLALGAAFTSLLVGTTVLILLAGQLSARNANLLDNQLACRSSFDELFATSDKFVANLTEPVEGNVTEIFGLREKRSSALRIHRQRSPVRREHDQPADFGEIDPLGLIDRLPEDPAKCVCRYPKGARGLPGRHGLRGSRGSLGPQGLPARLPCEPPIDLKKACPEPCPRGDQGPPGVQGIPGDRGTVGMPGMSGARGTDGEPGLPGPRGSRGIPGLDGETGDPGQDAAHSPYIPGPPGEIGDEGSIGPPGPVGHPGVEGPPGPIGPRGAKGLDGLPGERGEPGQPGQVGEPGVDGERGVCPTYCATDGGVFFVQPPDWFFKDGAGGQS